MLKTLDNDARNKLCYMRIKHSKWRKGRGKFRNNLFFLSLHSCLTVPLITMLKIRLIRIHLWYRLFIIDWKIQWLHKDWLSFKVVVQHVVK